MNPSQRAWSTSKPETSSARDLTLASRFDCLFLALFIRSLVCCGFGYLLSIAGTLVLFGGYSAKNVRSFAELYILGNLLAITATAFFVGPQKLCHRMVAKTRRVGTAIWFSLMIAIFVCAILKVSLLIIIVLLILETLAGIWYAASYIPFGRKFIVKCCQGSLFAPCPEACKPINDQV